MNMLYIHSYIQHSSKMKFTGLRVVRGPDWQSGDEDGGLGSIGTVIESKDSADEITAMANQFSKCSLQWNSNQLIKLMASLKLEDNKVLDRKGIVLVVWDSGFTGKYRAGLGGRHDLRVLLIVFLFLLLIKFTI